MKPSLSRKEYDPETKKWKKFATVLKIDRRPFAEGSMRSAYRMQDLTKGETQNEFVAKMSRDPNEQRHVYYDDVAMQMEAKMWAQKFNQRCGKDLVDFLVAYVAELVERPGKPVIGVEQRIHGNYVKYNNNWDWNDERRNTPQAFSHFTWEESKHTILICDLQGVGDRWTDPQIHSADGRGYGKGNMGMRGVRAFLNNHRCNAMCKDLRLPPTAKPAKNVADGTRLRPLEEAKREANEDGEGNELTRTQRKAEKVKNALNLPAGPLAQAAAQAPNRLVVQVCNASGLQSVGGACDASVTVMCGTQSGETRVVYASAEPEWGQRFQMALDSKVANLVAVVFDWSSVNDTGGSEPAIIGLVTVPFAALNDDSGFDEREWPLVDHPSNRPTGASLVLKILRYRNVPKMAAGAGGGAAEAGGGLVSASGAERMQLFESMQGIKVMIKEVKQLPLGGGGGGGSGGGGDAPTPVYAFVRIDNCEARTRAGGVHRR